MHILLNLIILFNYFINNEYNKVNIVLMFNFGVQFVHSFENEKSCCISILFVNDNIILINNLQ